MYVTFALFAGAMVHGLMLIVWRERIRDVLRATKDDAHGIEHHITVVVPARNAEHTLVPLLQDLFAQDLPKDRIDVVVVDDCSEDGTAAVVKSMMRTWPQLGYCLNRGEGKKQAITTGVAAVKQGVVLLTDADVRCGPGRARAVARKFAAENCALLVLPVRTEGGRSAIGRLQEEEQAGLLGITAGEALLGRPSLSNGANLAFTREAFESVGGYEGDRYSSGDDLFLVKRMRRAGMTIRYLLAEEALVSTAAEPTWKGFLHQRLRWAGKMRATTGALSLLGPLGMVLPWLLLWETVHCHFVDLFAEHGLERITLLGTAWLLWLVPAVALVLEVKRFLGQRRSAFVATLCYAAFMLYSPVIAVLALVVPTQWKGRPVRT